MKILAFDCSFGTSSLAIVEDNQVIDFVQDEIPSRQAENLIVLIESLLKDNAITYQDIDILSVSLGPGSFTGVRIALAAARGIALVAKKNLFGITTLESVAFACAYNNKADASKNILAVLDAKRSQVYTQIFDIDLNPITDPNLVYYQDINDVLGNNSADNLIITGNGANLVKEFLPHASVFDNEALPDARYIGLLAAKHIIEGKQAFNPAPLYLRSPDAKKPTKI